MKGNLYLIPAPLGENTSWCGFSEEQMSTIKELKVFIVEELRTARRYLRSIGFTSDFNEVTFKLLNEHTSDSEIDDLLTETEKGEHIGLLSEAGLPCIADPGNKAVILAHRKKIKVVPFTGPSSLMLALMASGLNGQNFAFHGYLPVKSPDREKAIQKIENIALTTGQTQIFIEAPYRNPAMLQSLLSACRQQTLLCLATDLTLSSEWIYTGTIQQWRTVKAEINKRPTVFLIGRQ
jgi:16S rRNA (cytidine1402-2'-O)-methyltransferase